MKKVIRVLVVLLCFVLLTACGGGDDIESVALLSATRLDVKMGETSALEVMNYTGDIKWASSNTSIVTVSETGEIKPVSIGSAAVVATLEDGDVMNCVVEVIPGESKVEKITVTSYYSNATDITVDYDDETYVRLKADCAPVDPIESLAWSSSDDSIAQVSGDGVVSVYGNGTVHITATALNGVSGSCKLRVKDVPEGVTAPNTSGDSIPVIEISEGQSTLTAAVPVASSTATSGVIVNEARVYLKVGECKKLEYVVANTSNTTIKWMSTDKSIAVVQDGYIVGVGNGIATISAVTHDGAVASCRVAVGKKSIAELKKEIPAY